MININVSKTTNRIDIDKAKSNYSTDDMTDRVVDFCNVLLMDSNKFSDAESEKTFFMIFNYIKKYHRILYSPISNICYQCFRDSEKYDKMDEFGSFISNIEKVSNYSSTYKYKKRIDDAEIKGDIEEVKYLEDTAKAVLKIWDHANLAQQQYNVLRLTEDEYRRKIDDFITPIKENINDDMTNLSNGMVKISDEMKDLSNSMSAQLLSIVGIFTALAFLIFGGISSLENIFSNTQLPLFKLMVIGSVWGLCIINLVFVFLFCIGKMTELNFKSVKDNNANVFQKYPIVWWCNLIILSIMAFSIWGYYITKNDVHNWFDKICKNNPALSTVIGIIIIAVIIGFAGKKLLRETEYGDNVKE